MRILVMLALGGVLTAAEPDASVFIGEAAAREAAAREVFVTRVLQSPAVQAAHERRLAAQAAAPAAGRLADPMLGGGYARKSTTGNAWPIYSLSLEQALPRWGERDAQRAQAAADIGESEAELLAAAGDAAAEIAAMLADLTAARAKAVLADKELARAEVLQQALTARLAVGAASIADTLDLQTRRAALAVERDTWQRQVADAEQEIHSLLALPADAGLPPFSAPDRESVRLERVPGMLAAAARQRSAEAAFSAAHAGRYPETAVGVTYEHEPDPSGTMETVGLALRVSLPVWQKAGALENAAAARARAAQREALGWQHRAIALLSRAERAATVAATARQAAEEARLRIEAQYAALMRQVATAQGPTVSMVLSVLDNLSRAESRVIDAEASAR
jgi:cobalt-zinc-cadmium efflux system outer membrane protein